LLISILKALIHRPLATSNISPAAVFRTIELEHPSLLIDEVDTMSFDSERGQELRGILNSGHARDSAYVIRTENVGDVHQPKKFSTWTPIAVAAIGSVPDTWADRSIMIPMKRKSSTRKVERLNRRNKAARAQAQELTQKIARWTADQKTALAEAVPKLPNGLDDRAFDNWELLIAIAERCGGTWPRRARTAATELSAGRSEPADVREQLLADIRQIFKDRGDREDDKISSASLCAALTALELGQWKEYGRQRKEITPNQVAWLLKPFDILPGTIWLSPDGKLTAKGYKLAQFKDVFDSYPAPPEPPSKTTHAPDPPDLNRQGVRSTGAVGRNGDFRSLRSPSPDVSKSDVSSYGEKRPDDLTFRNHGSGGESIKTGSDDPPDGVANDPSTNGTDPSVNRIPSQLPGALREALRFLGHTDQAIDRMPFLQCHEILRAELHDHNYADTEIREMTPEQKLKVIRDGLINW
jgi:putative DNA primase/helicase